MAKQKTGNTFLEEQIGYVEQGICKRSLFRRNCIIMQKSFTKK